MGEILALLTALVWAVAVILLKKTGDSYSAFSLNLFRIGVASVALVLTILFMRLPFPQFSNINSFYALALSGIIGIVISDTLFHHSLNLCGAGVVGIIDCCYPVFVTFLAYFWLRENITAKQIIGMSLIIVAVLISSKNVQVNQTKSKIILGVVYGVLSMFTVAVGVIIAKPALAKCDIIWATAIRQLAAFLVIFICALLSKNRKRNFKVFIPSKVWLSAMPATLLASYVALILWVASLKYAAASVSAILTQTSTIYIIILAAIFLKEKLTKEKMIASVLAIIGVLIVTVF